MKASQCSHREFLHGVEDNLYTALRAVSEPSVCSVFRSAEELERLRRLIRTAAVEATAIRVAAEAADVRQQQAALGGAQ